MKTTVTGRHIVITPALRAHVKEKVEHLARYSGRATSATVVLSVEKYRHQAEVSLNVDGVAIQAEEETSEMYASIDKAVTKIERQLKKLKDRQQTRRPRLSASRRAAGIVEAEPAPEPLPIERERPTLKIMTTEQAAAALDRGRTSLIVFRHAETEDINVVYRRPDGTTVWIDPAQ